MLHWFTWICRNNGTKYGVFFKDRDQVEKYANLLLFPVQLSNGLIQKCRKFTQVSVIYCEWQLNICSAINNKGWKLLKCMFI